MTKKKRHKESHVSHTNLPMGDNYGTGIRAKLGTIRDGSGMIKMSKRQLGTPPRGVV
jgi:hypothetical protein